MHHVPGNFLEISQRTVGLFVSPLFTLFLLGLFVKGSSQTGAILGSLASFLTAVVVAYWEPLTGLPMISFQWILPCSLIGGAAVGWIVSAMFGDHDDGDERAFRVT